MRTARVTAGKKVLKISDYLGWSQSELARTLGVQPTTVSSYKARDNANPSDEKIDMLIERLQKEHAVDPQQLRAWIADGQDSDVPFEKKSLIVRETQTRVYYNGLDDNRLEPEVLEAADAFTHPRIVRVKVICGEGSQLWSVKDAHREEMRVFDFAIASGRMIVKVAGDSLGRRRRGVVLGFEPDEYPHMGPYLLCSNSDNPDIYTVRYIERSGAPDMLLSPDTSVLPVKLEDWEILGWCIMEMRPVAGGGPPEVDFRPQGIGPHSNPMPTERV